MDSDCLALAATLLDNPGLLDLSVQQGPSQRSSRLRTLLSQRNLPREGWPDCDIEWLLSELSSLDSNNFAANVGVGEREARVFSSIISRRHRFAAHGIGRSGDIGEQQPKATGSVLMQRLTNLMAVDAMKVAGYSKPSVKGGGLVFPMATGMTLTLCIRAVADLRFKALQKQHGGNVERPRYVIWPRIDQRTCLKSIVTAGYTPIVVEPVHVGDALRTNMGSVRSAIESLGGPSSIVCILSTTSCFAPRVPDSIPEISTLCHEFGIPHIVNNAYGVSSSTCTNLINASAGAKGKRVDLFVQSTDKNFGVPVGGALVCGPLKETVEAVGKMYPGRASMAPIMDLFITLLGLGANGYKRLVEERAEMYVKLKSALVSVADKYGLLVLETPRNDVSIALSLKGLRRDDDNKSMSFIGSMLFSRGVSGARVVDVAPDAIKTIGDSLAFRNYGAHTDCYKPASHSSDDNGEDVRSCPYLTAAAGIGMTSNEIDVFAERLSSTLTKFTQQSTAL
ncbi:soluble liver antigen/liver pancreas antigen [Ramicandelaber brevisporus]|nr:soluble liver antigen/liver pancreas antigen [Ramicandelaber brevisporus]